MVRKSYRVKFAGGINTATAAHLLAGIIDRPADVDHPPVVVFSHCFTCNKDLKAIVRISRALAAAGIAVLRFDMSGLGGSEGDFSQTNFTTNLADLAAAITFAQQELGPVTALLGHSFGGAAALATAGRLTAALSLVITLAAPSDTQHLATLLSRRDPAIEREGNGSVVIGGRGWPITQQMLEDFRSHDLPALISQIQVPLVLIHSRQDETVSFDHALRIMSLAGGSEPAPPTSLVTLADADHLLTAARDLQFIAGVIAQFIHRYSPAS